MTAKVGAFFAVKLQHIDRHGVEYGLDLGHTGVNKQGDHGHKRRECRHNGTGLVQRNMAGAGRVKHQPDGIDP